MQGIAMLSCLPAPYGFSVDVFRMVGSIFVFMICANEISSDD